MATRKKIFIWILRLTALFVLLLAVLMLITPRLLNSDFARLKIQALVAEQAGAHIDYQKIKVRRHGGTTWDIGAGGNWFFNGVECSVNTGVHLLI